MPDQSTYSYDALISASLQDRPWVENTLLPRLQAAGLRIFVTEMVEPLDTEGRAKITRRIGEARYVVAVLSPVSLENRQLQFEWEIAIERNFLTRTFCLVPVKIAPLDDSQIPSQLAALTTVDFTKPDKLEMAFAYLLSIWEV
jgi:TIR domain-containing protein